MKFKNLILVLIFLIALPIVCADMDPNRLIGQARLDGSWAPAGTLFNVTAGGATVTVSVDDGINVVPAEFGVGKFKTDSDVPYWDTGDTFLIEHATGAYIGQFSGTLIAGTTNVGILDFYSGVGAPLALDAQLIETDNVSVHLNWTNVSNAQSYIMYYSTNLSKLENLDTSSIPAGVYSISNIPSNEWNDTNLTGIPVRYYRVAAVRGQAQNLSLNLAGKYIHPLIASSDGVLGRNLVAKPLKITMDAKSYLGAIPTSLNPSVSKLDRSNPEDENWISQVIGLPASLFDVIQEEGYMAFVNVTYNYTFVGRTYTNLTTNYLVASSDGVLGRNLIGVTYTQTGYNAKTYVDGLSTSYNPSVSKLDRSNPENEVWVSQVPGVPSSLFDVIPAEGYLTFSNTTYNYSLT